LLEWFFSLALCSRWCGHLALALKRLHLPAEFLKRFSLLLELRILGIEAPLLFFDDPEQALRLSLILSRSFGVLGHYDFRGRHAQQSRKKQCGNNCRSSHVLSPKLFKGSSHHISTGHIRAQAAGR